MAKSLRRLIGRAVGDFSMIKNGDQILAGLSGGKDSLVLLHALSEFRKRSPVRFGLSACTVVITGAMTGMDVSQLKHLENYCHSRDVQHIIISHPILEIIKARNERSPCSFCANMRRGILSSTARDNKFNKLALGHNMDDVVETFFMNIFYTGRAKSFQPKFLQDRTGIEVIRPLIYVSEESIIDESHRLKLPILKSICPYAGKTERQSTKKNLVKLKEIYPDIFPNIINALKTLNSANCWNKNS